MNENIVLSRVPDALTAKPIIITVELKHLTKWQKIKVGLDLMKPERAFEIKPICLGSLARISGILESVNDDIFKDLSIKSVYKAMNLYSHKLAEIISIALTNTEKAPDAELINFVLRNFDAADLLKVLMIVQQQMNITDFSSSIVLMKGLNVLQNENKNENEKPENQTSL